MSSFKNSSICVLLSFVAVVLSAPTPLPSPKSQPSCYLHKFDGSLDRFASRLVSPAHTNYIAPRRQGLHCIEVCRLGERRQLCNADYVFRSGVLLTDYLCNVTKGVCQESYSCPNETVLHPREKVRCPSKKGSRKESGGISSTNGTEKGNATDPSCPSPCDVVPKSQNSTDEQHICTRVGESRKSREMAPCKHIDQQMGNVYDFVHGQEVTFSRRIVKKGKKRNARRVCVCLNGRWYKPKALSGAAKKETTVLCNLKMAKPIEVRTPLCSGDV